MEGFGHWHPTTVWTPGRTWHLPHPQPHTFTDNGAAGRQLAEMAQFPPCDAVNKSRAVLAGVA